MGTTRRFLATFILLGLLAVNCGLAEPVIERVRESDALAGFTSDSNEKESPRRLRPTPRPTFTPTPSFTDTPTVTPTPTLTPIPTDTPTPPPTNTLAPTDTPVPTETPVPPTLPPPPPPTEPPDTPTPAPTPTPDYPFNIVEQGDRTIQTTNYHMITIYLAIIDANNIPIGGLKMVGDHSSGTHAESQLSDWSWSTANCLNCDYIKQGNLKFEPGRFADGTWNIYLADEGGTQLSETIPLSYSADPQTWVWDFLVLQRK